jgi:hypothetical protein
MNELLQKYKYNLSILKNFRSSGKYNLPINHDKLMVDSGGFSLLSLPDKKMFRKYIEYVRKMNPDTYINFDISCNPEKLKQYSLSVEQAQQISNENYWDLSELHHPPMPVIQGQTVDDYIDHIRMMKSEDIPLNNVCVGALVGREVEDCINILQPISMELPNSTIHGLGVSIPKLKNEPIRNLLDSADGHGYSFNIWYGDKNKNLREKLHRWIKQYIRFKSMEYTKQITLHDIY